MQFGKPRANSDEHERNEFFTGPGQFRPRDQEPRCGEVEKKAKAPRPGAGRGIGTADKQERMAEPPKVWVKVNAAVDAGVAEIVSLLNEIPGLQTIDSCQGEPGKAPAHVFFYYQDWRITGAFLFEVLAPRVKGEGADVLVSLEVSDGSRPLARLRFAAEAAPSVATAIRSTVQGRR